MEISNTNSIDDQFYIKLKESSDKLACFYQTIKETEYLSQRHLFELNHSDFAKLRLLFDWYSMTCVHFLELCALSQELDETENKNYLMEVNSQLTIHRKTIIEKPTTILDPLTATLLSHQNHHQSVTSSISFKNSRWEMQLYIINENNDTNHSLVWSLTKEHEKLITRFPIIGISTYHAIDCLKNIFGYY